MRPEWFKCEKCLWFKAGTSCWHGNEVASTTNDAYCSKWTCMNCWQRWDSCSTMNDLFYYINHSSCREVAFES